MADKKSNPSFLILTVIIYTVVALGALNGPYRGIASLLVFNSAVLVVCVILVVNSRMSALTAALVGFWTQLAICVAAVFGTRVDFDTWYQARGAGEVIAVLGGPVIVFVVVSAYYKLRPQLTSTNAHVETALAGRFLAGVFAAGFFLFANWERTGGPAGRLFFWLALGLGLIVGFVIFPMIGKTTSQSD